MSNSDRSSIEGGSSLWGQRKCNEANSEVNKGMMELGKDQYQHGGLRLQ